MGKGASSLRQRQRERIQVEKTEAKTHNLDQNLDNAFKDFFDTLLLLLVLWLFELHRKSPKTQMEHGF